MRGGSRAAKTCGRHAEGERGKDVQKDTCPRQGWSSAETKREVLHAPAVVLDPIVTLDGVRDYRAPAFRGCKPMNTSTYPHRVSGNRSDITRYLAWAALVVLVFTGAKAQTIIPIQNASFETPNPPPGENYNPSATNWSPTNVAGEAGIFNASLVPTTPTPPNPGNGPQVGYANSGGGLVQQLATTYSEYTVYTFSGYIGHRADAGGTTVGAFQIGVISGGTFIPLASQVATVSSAQFDFVSGTYIPAREYFGLPIAVAFVNQASPQALFDDASLAASVTAIPEPATSAMLAGAGMLGLTLLLRCRKAVAAKAA